MRPSDFHFLGYLAWQMQSGDRGPGQSEDEYPSQPGDWLRSYQVTQAWPIRALPGND